MSAPVSYQQLLQAGVHFGHLSRKWHPRMADYIFMERQKIHIIDLNRTTECLGRACDFVENFAKAGKRIMLVGTKSQAKDIIKRNAMRLRMPYVSERWLGGMLTNFATMRRAMHRMQSMEKLMREPAYKNLAKRERLMMQRDKTKRERMLGGVVDLTRPPDAMFVVDIGRERIAIQEALRLNIPLIAMVDTNCNPTTIDYPIPANDDSRKSIEIITESLCEAILRGTEARKEAQRQSQQDQKQSAEPSADAKSTPAAAPKKEENYKPHRIAGRRQRLGTDQASSSPSATPSPKDTSATKDESPPKTTP